MEEDLENLENTIDESGQLRPDPLFKDLTRKAALAAGLVLHNIELSQLLRTDLVLSVPDKVNVSNTMFHFFNRWNILEFKSENDTFDKAELLKILSRSFLFLSEYPEIEYKDFLTTIVCSYYPESVIEHLELEKTKLKRTVKYPWLLRFKVWNLEVAIVVCRMLPVEEKYYQWLLFAPSTSNKWEEFVKILLKNGRYDWLDVVSRFRIKELVVMNTKLKEEIAKSPSKEKEELLELFEKMMKTFGKEDVATVFKKDPKFLVDVIAELPKEQRDSLLKILNSQNKN